MRRNPKTKTYLGQPARIAKAFTNRHGEVTWVLKTIGGAVIATSRDYAELVALGAYELGLELSEPQDEETDRVVGD